MKKSKQALIYIILLNYNGYEDTVECISSLESIDYDNYEIVIVDNCSTDNSYKKFKEKYSELNYNILKSEYNCGFAGGNNIGIEFSLNNGADYVLLLNNDTIVEKNFLKELVESIEKEKNSCVGIGKIYYFSDNKRIWYAGGKIDEYKGNSVHFGYNEIDNGKYDNERYVEFATGCFLLISKKIIEKVGLLNEDYFLYYEDTDYCYKMKEKGINIKYCPKSVIYHKISASTGRKSYLFQYYYLRNRLVFIKKHIKNIRKLSAYFYVLLSTIKKLVTNQYKFRPIISGIIDYKHNKLGKKIFD